jgi:hypothetical protein
MDNAGDIADRVLCSRWWTQRRGHPDTETAAAWALEIKLVDVAILLGPAQRQFIGRCVRFLRRRRRWCKCCVQ